MDKLLVFFVGVALALAITGCGPSGVIWDCTCSGDCDSDDVDWEGDVCSDGTEDDAPDKAIDECRVELGCESWSIHCDCSATYEECKM